VIRKISEKMNFNRTVARILLFILLAGNNGCKPAVSYYSAGDFEKVRKTDAHFHYLTSDPQYIEFAASLNFRILNPIWDGEVPVNAQMNVAIPVYKSHPHNYAFFGTFPVDSFDQPDFAGRTIKTIQECLQAGAAGIKIWKNIGMVLKDSSGNFITIDNPAFEPVFQFLEKNEIPVIAHLGEPRDCWMPFDEMTDPGSVAYYRNNPQYHMYFHPEVPDYDDQIISRDNILRKYPDLDFVGAHLGSLEWSIDELAKRFDSYPQFKADLAARMFYLRYQSAENYEKVRDFMIRYQDRLIYGTDMGVYDVEGADPDILCKNLKNGWLNQWIYLATDSTVNNIKGLRLPAEVIDKIYYKNSDKYFKYHNH
jgi:predicted TIM-barrel fold metal-dependent hydrolase